MKRSTTSSTRKVQIEIDFGSMKEENDEMEHEVEPDQKADQIVYDSYDKQQSNHFDHQSPHTRRKRRERSAH